jgi:hypothetical protein
MHDADAWRFDSFSAGVSAADRGARSVDARFTFLEVDEMAT